MGNFMRLRCRAFVVLMLAGANVGGLRRDVQSAPPADEVRLTLSSQTIWQGEYGWCSFSAHLSQSSGAVSSRCGGAGPFGTASPGPGASAAPPRTLTDAEVATLRNLYQAANLFDGGGHVGEDYSGSDLPFYILIVRSSPPNRAVVLVVTGNPTFSSGPRKALFDWLLRERQGPTR
jgi:hypothetical protein